MTLKYLITGATGGLGEQVLNYFRANVPASEYAAASSNPSNKARFEDRGIAFRHVNYDDEESLASGLRDVENLLFVSTNVFDNERRDRQHRRLIDAAKEAGVKQVWYTSLAFGGFSDDSKAAVQQVHLITEKLLKESGITYTSIREGVYTEAFPVFMNWYPSSKTITLPADGPIAYTLRTELGEATARLMIQGGRENETVLLTAEETITSKEVIDIINETTGRQVDFQIVSPEEYAQANAANDQGGKPKAFFEMVASWWEDIADGALQTTHPLMREVLGREPKGPRDALREILSKSRDYTWHQNYV
ncbi:putative NmrA-like family protein [Aspergillus undulatus]|uniref:putative NmrA-like family protein n=1 Tax=Aspergillus undulatus TaxID=1810928 RepID=UPI003CCE0404